ncbi:MAG TPA: I78 family peptidase inhibitor [Gemmatimonadales bacterium]|jgi:hypothetical protein|nr:I78 family peptidase inhibitor [Gemmatimonadales bacterium]
MASILLLGGCMIMPPPPGPGPFPPPGGACNANGAQFIVGQPATPPNVEAARQAAGASTVRVIRPGQPVTMDFNFRRLNVNVNPFNFITSVSCG